MVFEQQCLVYHSGSGATYCLAGELWALFKVFLDQPDTMLTEKDLQRFFPNIDQPLLLLNQLLTMKLLVKCS